MNPAEPGLSIPARIDEPGRRMGLSIPVFVYVTRAVFSRHTQNQYGSLLRIPAFQAIEDGIPLAGVYTRILMMANDELRPDDLRYLDADHVQHPSGTFAGVTVCSQDDEKLGSISGVLVEPASRRVRYFVLERRTAMLPRRYMLSADTPAVLEPGNQTLRHRF